MMHFYTETKEGVKPRHFVQQIKDPSKSRASRVTDARKALKGGEIWYPSVTGILNILDKPALTAWKVDQHLMMAYEFGGSVSGSTSEGWGRSVKAATQERMDLAPKAGTDIHKVLEDFMRNGQIPLDETEAKICFNVEQALNQHCGADIDWECEKYFVDKEYGYAGCIDLKGHGWTIDYKSKQTAEKFKPGKMVYADHYRQLAPYAAATTSTHWADAVSRCANIFICLETGEIDFHIHPEEDIKKGWGDFKDCLSIYFRNTYNPLEK